MSAASTSIQAAPAKRSTGFAAVAGLALILAAALLLVAVGRLATTSQPGTMPAQVPAQVQFDHGWSSAQADAPAQVQFDHGWSSASSAAGWAVDPNSAANDAARHRSNRSVTVTADGIRVQGARGGAILYNGIPSTAPFPGDGGSGGSTRQNLPQ